MAVTNSITQLAGPGLAGWLARIRLFLTDFLRIAFDPYRPERHYMRGPGPACAAKRGDKHR